MIPRLVQHILKWPTYWTSSFFIQTLTKIPTICLLATRLYFIWLVAKATEIGKLSSSSSVDESSEFRFDSWQRKQKSLAALFLSISRTQLQLFSLFPFIFLKVFLIFFREGFWKNNDPPNDAVGFNPFLEAKSEGPLSDWLIKASHFAAGSLSSNTSTFPAFKGTISWKLKCWRKTLIILRMNQSINPPTIYCFNASQSTTCYSKFFYGSSRHQHMHLVNLRTYSWIKIRSMRERESIPQNIHIWFISNLKKITQIKIPTGALPSNIPCCCKNSMNEKKQENKNMIVNMVIDMVTTTTGSYVKKNLINTWSSEVLH